jgi:hypothetical protein
MDIDDLFPPPQRLTPGQQERIRAVLLDEIPPATAPGRPRRTHRRWRFLVAPAAAAAAVTAIAVTLTVVVPAGRSGSGPPSRRADATRPTGSQILLAAAARVAHQHPGKYWHILLDDNEANAPRPASGAGGQWIAHDGTFWSNPPCRAGLSGKVVMKNADGVAFSLGNPQNNHLPWTYDLVKNWPTSAAALQARIATYTKYYGGDKSDDLEALVALELLVPAPPGVRAAAYRAIAAFPGLQNWGVQMGGQAVFVPAQDGGPGLLVFDRATGLIHSVTVPVGTATTVFTAQWTNHLPKVIPRNKYYCATGH